MKTPLRLLPVSLLAILFTTAFAQQKVNVPEGTRALRDLSYVTNGHERQKLDLYLPEKSDKPTPVIVWIHGGAWVSGDKTEGCPPVNAGFTKHGYAAASLNYRLSGDAIFPAQIEDCKAALRWLRAHAKEYNLDADHIAVWGGSAGGHLVALLGATGHTREFDVGENLDQSSAVQAACDFFGPTDVLQMDAHALASAPFAHDGARSPESRLVGGPIQESPYRELAMRVDPIRYLTADAPPFLIVHGDQDPLVPHHQSEILFAALEKLGVPARFHTINGAGHGTGFGGKEISDMVAAFFELHLAGKKTEAANWPKAMTSSSAASAMPPPREGAAPNQRAGGQWQRPTWAQFTERNDANHDGKITRDELKDRPDLFERLDRNHDGSITGEEYNQGGQGAGRGPGPGGITWEVISNREDSNHDGKVPRSEFKGPPRLFDDLDKNRDGVLTPDDFKQPSK